MRGNIQGKAVSPKALSSRSVDCLELVGEQVRSVIAFNDSALHPDLESSEDCAMIPFPRRRLGMTDLSEREEERDLVRQRERTVDNLKRLYAFVFAVSFGVIGNGAVEKLKPLLIGDLSQVPSISVWLVDLEMLFVFLVTASVFFHQGAKYLDIRYARAPLSEAHPFGFAIDYLTIALTMAPFFLMA